MSGGFPKRSFDMVSVWGELFLTLQSSYVTIYNVSFHSFSLEGFSKPVSKWQVHGHQPYALQMNQ